MYVEGKAGQGEVFQSFGGFVEQAREPDSVASVSDVPDEVYVPACWSYRGCQQAEQVGREEGDTSSTSHEDHRGIVSHAVRGTIWPIEIDRDVRCDFLLESIT
jgi:hypothetical protein